MNAAMKLRLFLVSVLVFVPVVALTAHGSFLAVQESQAAGPELQVTVPVPTLPIETPPPGGDPPPGGGGGMNTIVIAMLVGIALVAFVGLLLWVASRGRRGPY